LKQVRIILAQMSKMLFDILSHIVASGFDVGPPHPPGRAGAARRPARRHRAAAVAVRLSPAESARHHQQRMQRTLHELRLRTVPLPELSAVALQVALADSGEGKLN
jgi:hypothetical protein